MKLLIDIPPEFESHFQDDKFEDSLWRLQSDAHLMAGRYERELTVMLVEAFAKAIPAQDTAHQENPSLKTAYWVWDPDGMDWNIGAWRCGECRAMSSAWWNTDHHNPMRCSGSKYCGNCGAKMEGALNAQRR